MQILQLCLHSISSCRYAQNNPFGPHRHRCQQLRQNYACRAHAHPIHRLLHFQAWESGMISHSCECTYPLQSGTFGHVATPSGSDMVQNTNHGLATRPLYYHQALSCNDGLGQAR